MTFWSKPIEGSTHVQFLPRCHIEESQVNGASACMTTLGTDIFLIEEHTLVKVGIKIRLHQGVRDISSPTHKMVYTHLRTVSIIYL